MGYLRKRFGEASTMAGLGVIASIAIPMVPPQYQMLAQGIAMALGLGGVVRPEAGKQMKLSDNFSLEELTFSDVAERKGISNKPSPEIIENLTRLSLLLEDVRKIFNKPIVINSGYRCPELNAAIGGNPKSQHCFGLAADIRVVGVTPDVVVRSIRDSGLEYDQLIREFDRWTHISIPSAKTNARKQALIIDETGTRGYV